MEAIKLEISLTGFFSTPLTGDGLFGHLCSTIVSRFGEDKLVGLLCNYHKTPFCVISDLYPNNNFKIPDAPLDITNQNPSWAAIKAFKQNKNKHWITETNARENLIGDWRSHAEDLRTVESQLYQSVSLSRHMSSTNDLSAKPFSREKSYYGKECMWAIYIVCESSAKLLVIETLRIIGTIGYGKHASIGGGQFEIKEISEFSLKLHENPNSYITLAKSAPQGLPICSDGTFYLPTTHFGKHGHPVNNAQFVKAPILLAQANALITPSDYKDTLFWGQAIGGNGELSTAIAGTVHQGFAPVLQVRR